MLHGANLPDVLEKSWNLSPGVREFLQRHGGDSGVTAAILGAVVEALQRADRPVLVWLEFQDCAGNTESMLRSSDPPVADVVLDLLSWEYHETIMAGAGKQAEAALKRVVQQEAGKYIAVVEGAIPTADGGVYCTIGGRTALDIATEVCTHAAACHCGGRMCMGWRTRPIQSEPDGRSWTAGSRPRSEGRESRWLPAQPGEYRGCPRALSDLP